MFSWLKTLYGRSFRERGCNLIEETWEALENHLSRERHANLTLLKKLGKKENPKYPIKAQWLYYLDNPLSTSYWKFQAAY